MTDTTTMPLDRAEAINTAMIRMSLWTIGLVDRQPDLSILAGVSLAEMEAAAHRYAAQILRDIAADPDFSPASVIAAAEKLEAESSTICRAMLEAVANAPR